MSSIATPAAVSSARCSADNYACTTVRIRQSSKANDKRVAANRFIIVDMSKLRGTSLSERLAQSTDVPMQMQEPHVMLVKNDTTPALLFTIDDPPVKVLPVVSRYVNCVIVRIFDGSEVSRLLCRYLHWQ